MKIAIYTCLTGGYDVLRDPRAVDSEHFDYLCFTDAPLPEGSVWQRREALSEPGDKSPAISSRRTKILAHKALPDYEWSVYMDANIQIEDSAFYTIILDAVASGRVFSGLQHPLRDCVWEELRECYLKDKISGSAAFKQKRHLRKMEMPEHFGLLENNVLLRKHLDPQVVAIDEKWWEEFCLCSGRDQLSLTPALFQLGLGLPPFLFGEGTCARNAPSLRYYPHPLRGPQRVSGRIDLPNLLYNIRLLWRKFLLLFL